MREPPSKSWSRRALLALLLIVSCPMSCKADPAAAKGEGARRKAKTGGLSITSTAFTHNEEIPRVHTCEGKDLSPPLAFSGIPAKAKSLVVIVDDPDAPDPRAPKRVWVHWVLYNIPPTTKGLAEGVKGADALPEGARQGVNDWKRKGYGGPCPPIGRHRYYHKLYVLDAVLPELPNPTKAAVLDAMKGHVLGQTELIGTYDKTRK